MFKKSFKLLAIKLFKKLLDNANVIKPANERNLNLYLLWLIGNQIGLAKYKIITKIKLIAKVSSLISIYVIDIIKGTVNSVI
ncbi:hypothetical protein CPU12_05720 [Malaciobacter molluscorum LMG 25693]|uniref:Uncharacterized protein n=1 Tax=Malaciobacter molluscorum LMG 25693 TaxID=870501 RepID=A0A2G1DJ66_9BACT|nr:hypothetical protein CPU12_05720 [Malaciobacter molluscorum LMG 25693]